MSKIQFFVNYTSSNTSVPDICTIRIVFIPQKKKSYNKGMLTDRRLMKYYYFFSPGNRILYFAKNILTDECIFVIFI